MSDKKKVKVAEIYDMSPKDMAEKSVYVQNAYKYILEEIESMESKSLKKILLNMLETPYPSYMEYYKNKKDREELYKKLKDAGYFEYPVKIDEFLPPQKFMTQYKKEKPPVWVASGSGYAGHHAHPGGLVLHTVENLRMSLAILKEHEQMFDLVFNKDMVIFAQVAHDLSKAWVLPWIDDDSTFPQYPMTTTGAHHIYALAESMYRNIPPEYVFAQACTHLNPGNKRNATELCTFLNAAALIAKIDTQKYGLFDETGKLAFDYKRIENWFVYVGDHSVVFTVPSSRRMVKLLRKIAVEDYGFTEDILETKKFHSFRNFVLSQLTVTRLFEANATGGIKKLKKEIAELFKN